MVTSRCLWRLESQVCSFECNVTCIVEVSLLSNHHQLPWCLRRNQPIGLSRETSCKHFGHWKPLAVSSLKMWSAVSCQPFYRRWCILVHGKDALWATWDFWMQYLEWPQDKLPCHLWFSVNYQLKPWVFGQWYVLLSNVCKSAATKVAMFSFPAPSDRPSTSVQAGKVERNCLLSYDYHHFGKTTFISAPLPEKPVWWHNQL